MLTFVAFITFFFIIKFSFSPIIFNFPNAFGDLFSPFITSSFLIFNPRVFSFLITFAYPATSSAFNAKPFTTFVYVLISTSTIFLAKLFFFFLRLIRLFFFWLINWHLIFNFFVPCKLSIRRDYFKEPKTMHQWLSVGSRQTHF